MTIKQNLTEHETNFVHHYSIHKKPSAAYRFAYTTENWPAQMVASEAQKILNRPHIALRLYEVATESRNLISVSVAQKKQWLVQIIESCVEYSIDKKTLKQVLAGDPKAAISAIAELNKMDGDLAAQKKEFSGSGGGAIRHEILSPADYKKARQEMLDDDDC